MTPVQIKYQPERSVTFLGSPRIVRLPDGALLFTFPGARPSSRCAATR